MSARGRGGRRQRGQGQLSMAEKRMLVKQRTHRWCSGLGSCHGKGTLPGSSLPHAACKGDGLIKLKAPRGRRRPGGQGSPRERRKGGKVGPIAKPVIGAAACYIGCVNVFGSTIGGVLSLVAMALMLVFWTLGVVGRMFGLVSR